MDLAVQRKADDKNAVYQGDGDCRFDVEGLSDSGLLQNGNLVSTSVTSYDSEVNINVLFLF